MLKVNGVVQLKIEKKILNLKQCECAKKKIPLTRAQYYPPGTSSRLLFLSEMFKVPTKRKRKQNLETKKKERKTQYVKSLSASKPLIIDNLEKLERIIVSRSCLQNMQRLFQDVILKGCYYKDYTIPILFILKDQQTSVYSEKDREILSKYLNYEHVFQQMIHYFALEKKSFRIEKFPKDSVLLFDHERLCQLGDEIYIPVLFQDKSRQYRYVLIVLLADLKENNWFEDQWDSNYQTILKLLKRLVCTVVVGYLTKNEGVPSNDTNSDSESIIVIHPMVRLIKNIPDLLIPNPSSDKK